MGFDIYAGDEQELHFQSYMGCFRMLYEQGYDWFGFLEAYDCYGGVSGNGESKRISKQLIEKAQHVLHNYNPNGLLSSEGRDEFTWRKPKLCEFMKEMIEYMKEKNETSILMEFS